MAQRIASWRGYPQYVLFVLLLVYLVAYVDRQVIVILGEAIKRDLGLTDTQLGMLTGFAFAILYVVVGVPVAQLADRASRVAIVNVAVVLWSSMTALCGLAGSFLQLLVSRVGVGVGEAGCVPPSHSIIADYFPRGRRASALGIFAIGAPVGMLVGFLLGGSLVDEIGWRNVFLLLGIPGVALGLLVFLTVEEPIRGASEARRQDERALPFAPSLRELLSNKVYVIVSVALTFHMFAIYAALNWYPLLLIRNFGLSAREVGFALALIVGAGAALGTLLGGLICDALARSIPGIYGVAPAIVCAISPICITKAVFATTAAGSLAWFAVPGALLTFMAGPVLHLMQTAIRPNLRALGSAVALFGQNLFALGLGPVLVGAASDHFTATLGSRALPTAMAIGVTAYWPAALCYLACACGLHRAAAGTAALRADS